MADPLAVASCVNCRFVGPSVSPLYVCRRRAPVPRYEVMWCDHNGPRDGDRWLASALAVWPRVNPDDWCGEFERDPNVSQVE